MSKLTRNNLQLFCRICLTALRPTVETIYNIHLVPQLTKLLIYCTSLDVNEDDDVLPKSLCQLCYDKLQDFQLFRSMAQHSAEVLNGIINGDSKDKTLNCITNAAVNEDEKSHHENTQNIHYRLEDEYDESADDNQLLLPELSTQEFCEKSIKAEPIDTEYPVMQINQINVHLYNGNQCDNEEVKIKNEIDSQFDDSSNFCERNALDSYGSTEDDYGGDNDGEDDANTTSSYGRRRRNNSSLISFLHNSTSGRSNLPRKRDRNKKSLKCPLCEKQVYKQVYLDAHIRGIHEGHDKPFLCEKCSKAFTRYNQLHVHIQSSHLKNAKFVCEFDGCDAMFKLMTTLETHRKVVHTSGTSPSYSLSLQRVLEMHQSSDLNQENGEEYICQQCFKKYSSKRALTEHLKRHANIKEHVCQVCGVAKVTRTELHTHMRTHEPNAEKFKCTICPQEFNHKNAIQRHIRVVHEGLRPFSCSFCPKRFGTRNSKMCHERLHTGERPFSCEICNKSFAQSEGLKSHMKNHDKSLRTHVCRFCFQRFITRKNLIDHEERHRGDKPHICEICSRGFYKYADLVTHRKSHEEYFEMNRSSNGSGSETYGEHLKNIEIMKSSRDNTKISNNAMTPNKVSYEEYTDRNGSNFDMFRKSHNEIAGEAKSDEDLMAEEESLVEEYVAGCSKEFQES